MRNPKATALAVSSGIDSALSVIGLALLPSYSLDQVFEDLAVGLVGRFGPVWGRLIKNAKARRQTQSQRHRTLVAFEGLSCSLVNKRHDGWEFVCLPPMLTARGAVKASLTRVETCLPFFLPFGLPEVPGGNRLPIGGRCFPTA